MPNSSCIWRQMYYWIFKRRWWRWWLTSFYVTGNKLKEPPIKTNEPGPYFGFGVNQSSEPVTAYQTTMMVLVLVAIWHWEDCCHPSRHKWSFRASSIIFARARILREALLGLETETCISLLLCQNKHFVPSMERSQRKCLHFKCVPFTTWWLDAEFFVKD